MQCIGDSLCSALWEDALTKFRNAGAYMITTNCLTKVWIKLQIMQETLAINLTIILFQVRTNFLELWVHFYLKHFIQ